MSPFVGLHATHFNCRDSIQRDGLIKGLGPGVYVYSDEIDCWGPETECSWGPEPSWGRGKDSVDIWSVPYIGPLMHDPRVSNALVLLTGRVTGVTLVTSHIYE